MKPTLLIRSRLHPPGRRSGRAWLPAGRKGRARGAAAQPQGTSLAHAHPPERRDTVPEQADATAGRGLEPVLQRHRAAHPRREARRGNHRVPQDEASSPQGGAHAVGMIEREAGDSGRCFRGPAPTGRVSRGSRRRAYEGGEPVLRHVGVDALEVVRAGASNLDGGQAVLKAWRRRDRPVPPIVRQPDARSNEVPGSADSGSSSTTSREI